MASQTSIDFSNRDLRRLLIPLLIEQLLAYTVGLADSMMVARVGEAAVSAVSLVDSVNVLLVNAFAALAAGGAIVTGQYLGARDTGRAGRSMGQLLLFVGESALIVTALLYAGKRFLLEVTFGAIAADVAAYADAYFMIVEASTFFMALYSAGAALFRVMGNSRVSMGVSLLMNAINVAGNAVLIFGLRMGVEGVAIPTLASRVTAAFVMLWLLCRKTGPLPLKRPLRLHHDRLIIRSILRLGIPNGIEGGMFQLGKILLLSSVAVFGTASVAANAVGNTIGGFQILAPMAVGLGMVTVVSRCVGAGEFARARFYTRKLMGWGYALMLLSNLLIFALLPVLLWVYDLSAEATAYARTILVAHGVIGVVLWPLSFQLPQALRAAGDTRFTMIVSSASMWLFRVLLGLFFARDCGLGVLGIWWAMFVDWVVRGACFLLRYRGGRWEHSLLGPPAGSAGESPANPGKRT